MTHPARSPDRSSRQRGASLVVTVVLLLGVLAVLALAIDLGMLFTARSEAQRAADAAALAGASAFLDEDATVAAPDADARALEYAERNDIRGVPIKENEVTVQVKTDSALVRVWVERDSLPTWFARLIGVGFVPVGAKAAARALPGGSARCLKPFALPDIWADPDDDTNGNHTWDPGENWTFNPDQGDYYAPYTGGDGTDATGYGSSYRNGYADASGSAYNRDYGREIQIKYTDPNSEFSLAPSMFLPWRIPEDPDMSDCSNGGGGGGSTGGAVYRRNICSCNSSSVVLGKPYDIEPGNMVGPTYQGVSDLINQDPGATWNSTENTVTGSAWPNWKESPRVVKVALFDPTQVVKSGMQSIVFNNFALFFIEGQTSPLDPVVGRFLWYVPGDGQDSGGPTGSLVLVVRLVE